MKRIALFAGTTEGRAIAEAFVQNGIDADIFVVSDYGSDLLTKSEHLRIHVGRLTEEAMEATFRELQIELILDATHPYAVLVTQNIRQAASACAIPYRRIQRVCQDAAVDLRNEKHYVEVPSAAAAAEYLEQTTGAIFLTTGSKELPEFCRLTNFADRIYARVLPSAAVAELCATQGIKGRHLIMMQGPFSKEMNALMLKETQARYLVTKQSGRVGGFEEKCEAAASLGITVVVIGPPSERIPPEEVLTLQEALSQINDLSEGRSVDLIGMGPGNPALISAEAVAAISKADLLIGAKRMVEMGLQKRSDSAAIFVSYQNAEIKAYLDAHPEYRRIAFLYSGDINIYSGAQSIHTILSKQDRIHEIHGMSSIDYLAQHCGYRREDLRITSVHGRDADIAAALEESPRVITLLGGSDSFQHILRELADQSGKNGESIRITLGERLSYPDERIRTGRITDFLNCSIDSLSVALFERECASEAVRIPRIMIAAPKSGGGKTTVTCGMIRAFQRRGLSVSSFKCGPDYIDPMFHASTLGVKTGNLDSYFTDPATLRTLFGERAAVSDLAVIEGVMGYFDGLGGTTERASSCEISEITETPVILVVDAKGASLSLVPVLTGILTFHRATRISGILLNRVSKGFYPRLKAMLEEELKKRALSVKILGYLPENENFRVPSRHLGLISPQELSDRRSWADGIAAQIEESVELDEVLALASNASVFHVKHESTVKQKNEVSDGKCSTQRPLRIAVAKDEAFSFYYAENETMLEQLGVELISFSPLHLAHFLKNVDGLILGGGYPELFGAELEANQTMRQELREAVCGGLPTIAECGGFLYLLKRLCDLDGNSYEMCGMIDADGFATEHLVRFGYCESVTKRDGLFGKAGCVLRGHEFHYWDATDNGDGLTLKKPVGNRQWETMVYTDTLAAGFPHFYYPGNPEAIKHFLATCEEYRRSRSVDERTKAGGAGDCAEVD